MTLTHLSLCLYLLAMASIGLYFRKRSATSLSHFFLGNRALSVVHVALSAVVSGRSAWLVLGVSGLAYMKGIQALWVFPGYTLAELFLCWKVGPILRKQTSENGDVTLVDYFVSKLGDKANLIRILSVAIIVIFYTGYISAQLGAGEKTFQVLFHFNEKWHGMLLTAIFVGLYTTMGGFLAVSLSDVIQALLMLCGLVLLPVTALIQIGGFEPVLSAIANTDAQTAATFFTLGSFMSLVSGLAIGFGSPGNPHILVRYMSIGNPAKLKQAAWIGVTTNSILALGAVCIGVLGRAMYASPDLLPLQDKETLFLQMTLDTFHPFFAGIILAALLAAIMSTVDSQILVVSSAMTRDLCQKLIWKNRTNMTDTKLVNTSRIWVIMVILFAFGLYFVVTALPGLKTIYNYVLLAWAGLGASFGPIVLLTIFWKGMNKYGAIASLVAGPILTIVFKVLRTTHPEWNIPYEAMPAFLGAMALAVGVSLATKR